MAPPTPDPIPGPSEVPGSRSKNVRGPGTFTWPHIFTQMQSLVSAHPKPMVSVMQHLPKWPNTPTVYRGQTNCSVLLYWMCQVWELQVSPKVWELQVSPKA